MKKAILIIAMTISSLLVKAQYHIRVECYDKNLPAYSVRFTPDNWKTSYLMMEAFDTSVQGVKTNLRLDVTFQECLFMDVNGGFDGAIGFAMNFKNATECFQWNKRQKKLYNKLYAYRSLHRYKDRLEPNKECCKTSQVY